MPKLKKTFWHFGTVFLYAFLCALVGLTAITAPVLGETPKDRVKALYLYNFLLFVDWPEQALSPPDELVICVLSKDRIAAAFRPLNGKVIKGRKVVVKHPKDSRDLTPSCNVLFIGASEKGQASRILEIVKNRPVLTISDIKNFARIGGMVAITGRATEGPSGESRKQRLFEIDVKRVKRAGIKIRARLLRLADIIENNQAEPHSHDNSNMR